jgi:hypothetical protein
VDDSSISGAKLMVAAAWRWGCRIGNSMTKRGTNHSYKMTVVACEEEPLVYITKTTN